MRAAAADKNCVRHQGKRGCGKSNRVSKTADASAPDEDAAVAQAGADLTGPASAARKERGDKRLLRGVGARALHGARYLNAAKVTASGERHGRVLVAAAESYFAK